MKVTVADPSGQNLSGQGSQDREPVAGRTGGPVVDAQPDSGSAPKGRPRCPRCGHAGEKSYDGYCTLLKCRCRCTAGHSGLYRYASQPKEDAQHPGRRAPVAFERLDDPPAEPVTTRAPFPWFGGKSRVAHLVWDRLGDVPNYVEPFAGSLAVLLARPTEPRVETVNDVDCYLANFWRAVTNAPADVAAWADSPVNEADLHARHRWLVDREEFRERMKTDPEFFDAKIAGWWVWGISQWIGSGWCSAPEWRGRTARGASRGIHTDRHRSRPDLHASQGVHRKRQRLGGNNNVGVHKASLSRQVPRLGGDSGAAGAGVHASALDRKAPKADRGSASRMQARREVLLSWFGDLQSRLRRVRVCCGDWRRVMGPAPTTSIGLTGIFLDPPYDPRQISAGGGTDGFSVSDALYAEHAHGISAAVREWAIEHGDDPKLRIALCGYEGEHEMPSDWSVVAWKAGCGYSNRGAGAGRNRDRERIWFSPHCLQAQTTGPLFKEARG